MSRKLWSATVVAGAVAAAVMPMSAGQASIAAVPVLDLQFNEPPGSTVAVDTSGRNHHGQIGSHVEMKTELDALDPLAPGTSFADFDRHPPGEGVPYGFDHLVAVPDAADGSLDPGTEDFTVEFRFRTKEKFGNIMQKGQARTVGGQIKFQIPKGKLSCMFKGSAGRATAGTGALLLNDNQWHTVRCERTSTAVSLYVDGNFVSRKNGATGKIDNKKFWTMGGKYECDAVTVTCDYFAGEIDWVRLSKG
jgi:hypothetical protein